MSPPAMLTRRVFRALTDSLLHPHRPLPCLRAGTPHRRPSPSPSPPTPTPTLAHRAKSSASSTRWRARHATDAYARDARVQHLKSRAAFKLLQIHDRHHIFPASSSSSRRRRGRSSSSSSSTDDATAAFTTVDLGFAPGSWSQVAAHLTAPRGRVVGIDVLPVRPPAGVSAIQGDVLSADVRAMVRAFVRDGERGRRAGARAEDGEGVEGVDEGGAGGVLEAARREGAAAGRAGRGEGEVEEGEAEGDGNAQGGTRRRDEAAGRVVDVVLSDMCAPWEQTTGFWLRTVSDAYDRMMNTSGIAFKDHAGSMDLCDAALRFCFDTLRTGGHLVCKFYQGNEDKILETRLKCLFEKVVREKPDSSRKESRESFFVALRRKEGVQRQDVWRDE